MHVVRKCFTSLRWKTVSRRAVAFPRIESHVNLHSKSIAQQRTKLEVKPFWKINAVLNNVSLVLSCNVDEEFFVDIPENQRRNGLDIKYDCHRQVASMTFDGDLQSVLALSLPFRVDFDIVLKGTGNASIGGVENETVQVDAENYDIMLGDLKSHNISVVANKGDIHCAKTLKGNIKFVSRDGDVATQKIQGHNISIACETGYVEAGDIYAEELSINAGQGMQVKSTHGRSQLRSKGGIVIGTAEGDVSLLSRHGDIDLHLADHARDVDVTAERGNIELSFSSDMNGEVSVDASAVDDSDSGLIQIPGKIHGSCARYRSDGGDGLTTVSATSPNGTTSLRRRTWLGAISAFSRKSKEPR